MNPTKIVGAHKLSPETRYYGTWSGWQVKVGEHTYELDAGIRGTSPAWVVVDMDGNATVRQA